MALAATIRVVSAMLTLGWNVAVFETRNPTAVMSDISFLHVDRATVLVAAEVCLGSAYTVCAVPRTGVGLDSCSDECEDADGDGSD